VDEVNPSTKRSQWKQEVFKISSMGKYLFPAEKELLPSDQIAEPINVLNLSALIIAMIFCIILFQII